MDKRITSILRDKVMIKAQVSDVVIRENMLAACDRDIARIYAELNGQGELPLNGGSAAVDKPKVVK